MKRKIISVLGALLLAFGVFGSGAWAAMPSFGPDEGVVVFEVNSGDILVEQNADERYYPASTTKLMTALTALDYVGSSLNDKITVGDEVKLIGYESSVAHLEVGEIYTWEQLLYALLLPSGNDAANVIAANIGRKISGNEKMDYNQAMSVFVDQMNAKAQQMGLKNTHFKNAHGLHDPDHYTTPADMAVIGKTAFSNETISKVEGTKVYEMTTNRGEPQKWKNTDMLLYKDAADYGGTIEEGRTDNLYYNAKAKGGKTGNTDEAGRCFVYNAEDGDAKIVGVIMKGDEKGIFAEASSTINAAFDDNRLLDWTDDSGHYKDFTVINAHYKDGKNLSVKTKEAYSSMIPKGQEDKYTAKVSWDTSLLADTEKGLKVVGDIEPDAQVGTLTIYEGTDSVKSTPLYAQNQIRPRNFWDYLRIAAFIGIPLLVILFIFFRFYVYRKRKIMRAKQARARRRAKQKLYESQGYTGSGTPPRKTTTGEPQHRPQQKRPSGSPPRRKPSGSASPGRPVERNATARPVQKKKRPSSGQSGSRQRTGPRPTGTKKR